MNKTESVFTIIIGLENKTNENKIVHLFESNRKPVPEITYQNDNDIILKEFKSLMHKDYAHLLNDIQNNPITIKGFKILPSKEQEDREIKIVNSFERFTKKVFNNVTKNEMFEISGSYGMKFIIHPNEVATISLRVLKQSDRANSLSGKHLEDEYVLQEPF